MGVGGLAVPMLTKEMVDILDWHKKINRCKTPLGLSRLHILEFFLNMIEIETCFLRNETGYTRKKIK